MKRSRRNTLLLAIAPLAVLGLAATALQSRTGAGTRSPAAPTAPPARWGPVRGIVYARPFALAEPYVHEWRLEKPAVNGGWLVVLEVDPQYVEPRQVAMPVLMVGGETVECLNFGYESGRVVGIVPAALDERGLPALDLASSPAWFATAELPERVDAAWIAAERARARPEDVATFTDAEIAAARARGGELLQVADRVQLDREAAALIIAHAPSEHERAEGLLVPVTK